MATYKEIKGVTIQTRDEDPSLFVGSWASGGALNTSRSNAGGAGIQTSALMVGKDGSPQAIVEEYNGSSWTEVGDLTTGRNAKAMGANAEAVLAVGGYDPGTSTSSVKTESWNGSSWTEVNDLNVKREAMGTFGIYTAGIIASGFERGGSPARPVNVESWNGSSWTEVNNVNTGRSTAIGSGLQPSGILSGGAPAPATNLVESWDGTSWTEVGDMNQNRGRYGGGSGTSNTSVMVFGGYADPPTTVIASTEVWDGSSWTEVNDLSSARNDIQASSNGPTSLSLAFGGLTPPETTATEEWSFPSSPVLTEGSVFLSGGTSLKGFGKAAGIPAATWSSGGSLNTARKAGSGGGRQTNAIAFAGFTTTATNVAETYDGTSFTEVADLNTARRYIAGSGATGTAAIGFGGQTQPGPVVANTETWNGSSWTETGDLNTARGYLAGANFAPSSASLGFGGDTSNGAGTGDTAITESWDGTSWTEVGDLNTGRRYLFGSGVQTSAILAGGLDGTSNVDLAETWDGSSWSEVSEINTGRRQQGSAGANNSSAIIYGGTPPTTGKTEVWNGSSWSEINDLSTARYDMMNAGSGISAFGAGGETTTVVSTTEEWTVDNALSTVTVS